MKIRPSVQAVIFDRKTKKLLLIKKVDLIRKGKLWRLVRGGVEEGETEEQALKREVKEEVGLSKVKILDKIYNYEYVWYGRKHIVAVFAVEANMREKVILQGETKFETAIIGNAWVTKEDAIKMLYWGDEKKSVKLLK